MALKDWKKYFDHRKSFGSLVYKKDNENHYVSIYKTSKGDIWVDSQNNGEKETIATEYSMSKALIKAKQYMRKN